jgi:deoxyribodipyrimidine photo-lyase
VEDLQLLPKRDWADSFGDYWTPTRGAGLERLDAFLRSAVEGYHSSRDIPSVDGTSRLSPYLHWGQLGVREISGRLQRLKTNEGVKTFYNELVWREFAAHVLFNFPETPSQPLQDKYRKFPWQHNKAHLKAWQQGKTGYPIVDAGMRQLWQKGWMHNRVRMVVASVLVKHLLQPWQEGAKWFWDCLVDADLASNSLGWQWAGGCGADAAPYFRVFNPVLQGEKFDKDGSYVREFVPALKSLPNKYIHQPWEAPPAVQEEAGIRIGTDYPHPIVEHKEGRRRALEALNSLQNS